MKLYLSILLVLIVKIPSAQKNFNLGIEGQFSYFNGFNDFKDLTRGLSLVLDYKKFELNLGYTQHNAGSFSLNNKDFSVIGPNFGLKYHISKAGISSRSNFFLYSNFQWRNYYEVLGAPPYGIHSNISEYHLTYRKSKSINYHLGLGYELYLTKRISIPIYVAAGVVRHNGKATPFGITYGYTDLKKWEFSPLFQIGLKCLWYRKNENHEVRKRNN